MISRRLYGGFIENRVLNCIIAIFKRHTHQAPVALGPSPAPAPSVVASIDMIGRSLKHKVESLIEDGSSKVEALMQVDELCVHICQLEQEKMFAEVQQVHSVKLRERWTEAREALSFMRRDRVAPSWDLVEDVLEGNSHGYHGARS